MPNTIVLKYKDVIFEASPDAIVDFSELYHIDIMKHMIRMIDRGETTFEERKTFGDKPYIIEIYGKLNRTKRLLVEIKKSYILI